MSSERAWSRFRRGRGTGCLALLAFAAPACGKGGDAAGGAPPSETAAAPHETASTPMAVPSSTSVAEAAPSGAETASSAPTSAPPSAPSGDPGCLPGMARIGKACVDKYEARLVVRDAAGAAQPHPHYLPPEPGTRYEAESLPDVFPQAYVSQVEARKACKNAGKRLCSYTEWRRACEGKRATYYPYGPRYRSGACNSGKAHLLEIHFGPDPRRWKYDEHFNDPELDQLPGFLDKAGAHPACVSESGVADLVGNLHEWVGDKVSEAFMERLEADKVERRKQPWHPGNGVFAGGFFSTIRELGPGCRFITVAHEPTYHDYSTGFRCCADATDS